MGTNSLPVGRHSLQICQGHFKMANEAQKLLAGSGKGSTDQNKTFTIYPFFYKLLFNLWYRNTNTKMTQSNVVRSVPKKFLDPKFFLDPIFFEQQFFLDPKFFLEPKFFLTQNFFGTQNFLTQNCFRPNTFWTQNELENGVWLWHWQIIIALFLQTNSFW